MNFFMLPLVNSFMKRYCPRGLKFPKCAGGSLANMAGGPKLSDCAWGKTANMGPFSCILKRWTGALKKGWEWRVRSGLE